MVRLRAARQRILHVQAVLALPVAIDRGARAVLSWSSHPEPAASLIEETRPGQERRTVPRRRSACVVEAPAKLAAVKMLVAPVLIGSSVAMPNVMRGHHVSLLAICCHELTCVNSPPNESWCEPCIT